MAASSVSKSRLQGIGVHDPRVIEDNIEARGAGSTDSSFTQAGALPGRAVADQTSKMAFAASGSQADEGDIEIRTQRGGGIGPDRGGFLWRDVAAGESAAEYKGWDGFQAVTGFEGLFRDPGEGAGGSLPAVVRLDTGAVLMCHQPAGATTTNVEVQEYDPSDGEWSTLAASLNLHGVPDVIATVALVQMPDDGRVLLFAPARSDRNVVCWYSDDDGAAWSPAAFGCLRTDLADGSTINEIRASVSAGQILLLIQYNDGSNEQIAQYGSTERGVRFDQVKATWDTTDDEPNAMDCTALTGGGFLVAYHDGQASSPQYHVKRIGSAFETLEDAETLASADDGGGRPSVAVWEDEDGSVYCITAENSGSSYETILRRSTDRGDSWDLYGGPLAELRPGTQTVELNEFAATSTGGLGLLVSRYTGNGDAEDNSALVCVYLGGHSSHTLPATDEDVGGSSVVNFPDNAYITWSESNDSSKMGGLYLAVEEPGNTGWTAGGAGTDAISSDQRLTVTTISNARSFARTSTDDTLVSAVMEFEVEVNSGSGDETTKEIAAELILSDYDGSPASATFTYKVSVRLAHDKFRLYDDNAGSSLGEVTADLTSSHLIRVLLDSSGYARMHTVEAGRQVRAFAEEVTASGLTNTTADTPNTVIFGHSASGTATSHWTHVGYNFWGSGWNNAYPAVDALANGWNNPLMLHTRSVPAQPVLVTPAGLRIKATDGPAIQGETWRIANEATYALANVLPTTAPSPRRGWRSAADNVEEYFVVDIAESHSSAFLMNHALVVGVLSSNLETIEVEGWDGAAWQSIVSLDSTTDWDSLQFDQRAYTLQPRSGVSTTGERYFWYGAHAGDTVDMGNGAPTTDLHKVKRNTEGAWIGQTTTKKPTILLETDASMAAANSNGTMKIRRKDFGAIVHSYNDVYNLLRFRIPAQHTADNDYRIGTLFFGHIAVFGRDYDRGRSITREFDAEVFRRIGGSRRARTRGPSRRVVEFAWANQAVDSSRVQDSSPDPNYVIGQTSVDLGIATVWDAIQVIEGVAEEAGGPVSTVLYLPRIPVDSSADHPLSDWRELVYGRIESDHRTDNVLGDEGVDEMNRSGTVTIREEK